jgi:hypothetical protein
MPIHKGSNFHTATFSCKAQNKCQDENILGKKYKYYQYGSTGKKYYYVVGNKKSRELAYSKCLAQVKAIHSN